MARKTGSEEKNGFTANFADIRLQKNDSLAFFEWMSDVSNGPEELMTKALKESYRITFKYDYHNRCHQNTWTQQDEKHKNAGIVLISRSDDPWEAMALNAYKVFVLFRDEALPLRDDTSNWG